MKVGYLTNQYPARHTFIRIEEQGLTKCMRRVGWLDDAAIRELIEGSRALVVRSFGEGLVVVVLESMARGRSAIATSIGAIGELLRHRETRGIVAPGSVEELVDAMRTVIQSGIEALELMGRAGRERGLQRYDVSVSAEVLAGLFARYGAKDENGGNP